MLERLYDLGMALLSNVLLDPLLSLWVRLARCSPQVLAQRRGLPPPLAPTDKPRWLLHGASAGELAAAAPLLTALAERRTELQLVLSSHNPAGIAMATRLASEYPMICAISYLPWDHHRRLCHWLGALGVDRVIVLETELWPGLYRACETLAIPLALINARLYPADYRRYRWVAALIRRSLQRVQLLAVRDSTDASLFRALGAAPQTLRVTGELRHDLSPAAPLGGLPGDQAILLGASTHAPEESYLMNALAALQNHRTGLRLLLAPRQVKRCASLERSAQRQGLRVVRWSQMPTHSDWQILLLDQMGLLPRLYAHATLVFIGGSFSRHGGHSPVESALHGRAMLIGPGVAHVATAVQQLRDMAAIEQLSHPDEFKTVLSRLLDDPAQIQRLGDNARRWALAGCGAATRQAQMLVQQNLPGA